MNINDEVKDLLPIDPRKCKITWNSKNCKFEKDEFWGGIYININKYLMIATCSGGWTDNVRWRSNVVTMDYYCAHSYSGAEMMVPHKPTPYDLEIITKAIDFPIQYFYCPYTDHVLTIEEAESFGHDGWAVNVNGVIMPVWEWRKKYPEE